MSKSPRISPLSAAFTALSLSALASLLVPAVATAEPPPAAVEAPAGGVHGQPAHGQPAHGQPEAIEEPHGEAHGGGIEWVTPVFGGTGKLGLLWILINFAVLMWLLEKLLFSKLRASTARKHDEAKTELDRATTARQKAEATLAEYETRLQKLETEIAGLLAEASTRAKADRARIVEAAQVEAEQIKAAARAAAEREAAAIRRKLEAEVVDRAVERAEAIIREQITPADQRTMVDDFIGRLGAVRLAGPSGSAAGGAAGGPTA